jgi:hypothetical protein
MRRAATFRADVTREKHLGARRDRRIGYRQACTAGHDREYFLIDDVFYGAFQRFFVVIRTRLAPQASLDCKQSWNFFRDDK